MKPMRWIALAMGLMAISVVSGALANPTKIRLGYANAAEEQLWLLMAKPDIGANYGKAYTLDASRFSNSAERSQAFAAKALDIASTAATGALFAAAEGVPAKIIASLSRESTKGEFSTGYYVLDTSPIKAFEDMRGKIIGINGFSTSGELWARAAFERKGLPFNDINFAVSSFAAMSGGLRAGKIDVGQMPQPFAAMAEKEMKLRRMFTAKDGAPFDEELIVLISTDEYLKKNAAAVKAFLADLAAATKFYLARGPEARQILIDKKFMRVPPDVYLNIKDYYRDPTMRVDAEALRQMQNLQVKAGFQKKSADVGALVDLSYLPAAN